MPRQHDPSIPVDAPLYRRIPWPGDRVTWDDQGEPAPTKSNFLDKDQELSLYIAAETTPDRVLDGHPGFGLIQITYEQFVAACQEVGTPDLLICRDEDDPANGHVLICGNVTRGMAKKLQHGPWEWVVKPNRDEPET